MKAAVKANRSKSNGAKPQFVLRAERAFRRAARQVRAEHRKVGLRPLVWR
jgi:hypothetical protein